MELSQAGEPALPSTITLEKLWKTLSTRSLSEAPYPAQSEGSKKKGNRELAESAVNLSKVYLQNF